METFLRTLINKIIDNTNDLKIEMKEENNTIKYYIRTSGDDTGKLVGKKGRNINAIRTIMRAIGVKELRKRVEIYIEG